MQEPEETQTTVNTMYVFVVLFFPSHAGLLLLAGPTGRNKGLMLHRGGWCV